MTHVLAQRVTASDDAGSDTGSSDTPPTDNDNNLLSTSGHLPTARSLGVVQVKETSAGGLLMVENKSLFV